MPPQNYHFFILKNLINFKLEPYFYVINERKKPHKYLKLFLSFEWKNLIQKFTLSTCKFKGTSRPSKINQFTSHLKFQHSLALNVTWVHFIHSCEQTNLYAEQWTASSSNIEKDESYKRYVNMHHVSYVFYWLPSAT